MTSSAFLDLSDTDRYLLRRLAVRQHVRAEELAAGLASTSRYLVPARHTKIAIRPLLSCCGARAPTPRRRSIGLRRSPRRVLDQIDQLS
ncbi:MAG: hypothetical protein ACRDSR_02510 [Pseudonocardiaceae bacterium]